MDTTLKIVVLLSATLYCNGVSIREQLADIARRFNMPQDSVILGAPSFPSHLPEAEAILPGHTLLRPALGMLKSAIKFPHREREHGAGVYGNNNNLGLRYDGRNERLMYSGFRRSPTEVHMFIPESSELNSLDSIQYQSSEELYPEEAESELRQAKQRKTGQKLLKRNIKRRIKIYPAKTMNINPVSYESDEIQNLLFIPKHKRDLYRKKKLKKLTQAQAKSGHESSESELCWSNKGLHGKPNTKCTKLDTRLHTKSEILAYIQLMLSRIHSERRQSQNMKDISVQLKNQVEPEIIKVAGNPESSGFGDDGFIVSLDGGDNIINQESKAKEKDMKSKFWKTKDTFNHIKFSPDAPELDEYLPVNTKGNDEKNWWFYHQEDFRPFNENDV